jgi:hypothetical protein
VQIATHIAETGMDTHCSCPSALRSQSIGPGFPHTFAPSGEHGLPISVSACAGLLPMRTAIGATAVNIAKPTNLGMPMIHAFLDNIRYITIELNGLTLYDIRDDVPCDMDKWRETRARFPAPGRSSVSKDPDLRHPGRRSEPHPFAKVGLSQKFVSEITFSNLRFLYLSVAPPTSMDRRFIATSPSDRWRKPTRSRPTPRTFVLCRGAHRYRHRHPHTPLTLF